MLLVLAVLAAAVLLGLRHLPPEWDPRAPLDLRAAPGLMTRVKLAQVARAPEACFAAFAASGIAVQRVADRPSTVGCGVEDAVLLPSALRLAPAAPVVTCRVAAAWTLFERHALQPAAREHLGAEVARMRHLGTHSCRNVNHAATGRRSQHATANAIDVAGLTLRDGREVTLLRDWGGEGAEARFLRAAQRGACRWFRGVLGPGYNALHADHFHLDMGPWTVCR